MASIKKWRSNIRNIFESADPGYFREEDDEPVVTGDFPEPEEDTLGDEIETGDDMGMGEVEETPTITMDRDLFVKIMKHVAGIEDEEDMDIEGEGDLEGDDGLDGLDDMDVEGEEEEVIQEEDEELEDLDAGGDEELEDMDAEDDMEDETEGPEDIDIIADKAVELSAEGMTLTVADYDAIIGAEEAEEAEEDLEGDEIDIEDEMEDEEDVL